MADFRETKNSGSAIFAALRISEDGILDDLLKRTSSIPLSQRTFAQGQSNGISEIFLIDEMVQFITLHGDKILSEGFDTFDQEFTYPEMFVEYLKTEEKSFDEDIERNALAEVLKVLCNPKQQSSLHLKDLLKQCFSASCAIAEIDSKKDEIDPAHRDKFIAAREIFINVAYQSLRLCVVRSLAVIQSRSDEYNDQSQYHNFFPNSSKTKHRALDVLILEFLIDEYKRYLNCIHPLEEGKIKVKLSGKAIFFGDFITTLIEQAEGEIACIKLRFSPSSTNEDEIESIYASEHACVIAALDEVINNYGIENLKNQYRIKAKEILLKVNGAMASIGVDLATISIVSELHTRSQMLAVEIYSLKQNDIKNLIDDINTNDRNKTVVPPNVEVLVDGVSTRPQLKTKEAVKKTKPHYSNPTHVDQEALNALVAESNRQEMKLRGLVAYRERVVAELDQILDAILANEILDSRLREFYLEHYFGDGVDTINEDNGSQEVLDALDFEGAEHYLELSYSQIDFMKNKFALLMIGEEQLIATDYFYGFFASEGLDLMGVLCLMKDVRQEQADLIEMAKSGSEIEFPITFPGDHGSDLNDGFGV